MKTPSLALGVLVLVLGGMVWVQRDDLARLTAELDAQRGKNPSLTRAAEDLRRGPAAVPRDIAPPAPAQAANVSVAPPAPPPKELPPAAPTRAQEMQRRLAAVNSRETALDFLALFSEYNPVDRMQPEDRPKFRILGDDDLTEEERRNFAGVRASAAEEGRRAVFLRVEGSPGLQILNSGGFDPDSLPPRVREFLTESDLQKFQDQMLYQQAENTVLRNRPKSK